jgi:outer membrane protein, heavy metal efflux system
MVLAAAVLGAATFASEPGLDPTGAVAEAVGGRTAAVERPMHRHEPLRVDPALTWPALVDRTLAAFPGLAAVEARAREADALMDRADRWLAATPAVYFDYLSDGPLDDLGQREYDVGLDLPLWRWAERRAARGVGTAVTVESTAAAVTLRWQIVGLLRTSLWDIASAANSLQLARASLEVATELVRVVERRNESGDLPDSDVLLARSAMLEKQTAVLDAEALLLDAERSYKSLTGLDRRPETFAEPLTEQEDFDDGHPLLALATARVERAQADLDLVDRETRGHPVLTIGPHRQRDPLGTIYSNSLYLGVRVPFGGKSYGAADRARAVRGLADAESERGLLLRQLDLDLHEAEHTLSVTEQSLEIARNRAELSERQWQMGQTAFAQGEIDLRDLLRIQDSASTATHEVARLEIERQRTIAALNQAVGDIP